MQTANSSKRSNLQFYYAGSATKSSKRWRSGMSAWCISSRAALVIWQHKAQVWQHTGKVHQVTGSVKFRNPPEVKILQDHLTHLSKIQWSVEKEQGTKELGRGFELILLDIFPVLWLIWSNMTIQVLVKGTDPWEASPAPWLLWQWQYWLWQETRSHPMFQTWSALAQPFVTTIFPSFKWNYTANRKNKAGSTVNIAAPGGSKMTIPQGVSTHKSPWSSTPPKGLVLQGIFARLGKKMKTQILPFFFPSIYSVTYSYRQLPRFASTEYDITLSTLISHQTLLLWANTTAPLISSAASSLLRSIFKNSGSASRQ